MSDDHHHPEKLDLELEHEQEPDQSDLYGRVFGPKGFLRRNIGTVAMVGCVVSGLIAVRVGFSMGIKRSAMTQARFMGNPGAVHEIQDKMFSGSKSQVNNRMALANRALKYVTVLVFTGFGFGTVGVTWALGIRSLDDIRPTGERIFSKPRLAVQNSRFGKWVRGKREAVFPALEDDPTGMRALSEALAELDQQEQDEVQELWNWLNTPTQLQMAEMMDHSDLEDLEEEYAMLVGKKKKEEDV